MGQIFTKQQVAGLLLVNFAAMTQEWRKAVALFFYLDITNRDAKEALQMADELLQPASDKPFPFNISKVYGLEGTEPQVDITLDSMYGRVTLLGGIDDSGSVYVLCALGSKDERKEALAAIEKQMMQLA